MFDKRDTLDSYVNIVCTIDNNTDNLVIADNKLCVYENYVQQNNGNALNSTFGLDNANEMHMIKNNYNYNNDKAALNSNHQTNCDANICNAEKETTDITTRTRRNAWNVFPN